LTIPDDVRDVEVEPESRGVRLRFNQRFEPSDSVNKKMVTTAVAIVEVERKRSVDQLSKATDFGVLIFKEIGDERSFSRKVKVDDRFGGAGPGVDWRREEIGEPGGKGLNDGRHE
jgi:hypothetical protein